jgi:opacity protein-like surface antigen
MSGRMRLAAMAAVVASGAMYAGVAQASVVPVPPTPATDDALTAGGPSVSYNFKTGDWHEFTFTVASGATDDLDIGNANDTLTVDNFTGAGSYLSGPTNYDVPFSIAYTAGSYDVYLELADGPDPENSVSLVSAISATPLPAALPLFAGGLGVLGLFGRRRKQKALDALAA